MNNNTSPHHIPWAALAFLLIALVSFFNLSGQWNGGGVFMNQFGKGAIPPMMATEPSNVGYTDAGYGGGMMEAQGTLSVSSASVGAPVPMMPDRTVGIGSAVAMPVNYQYYSGEANANDTREFNKIYYNASMQTRDVQALTRRVETTVRGHGGRVDNTSSSQKFGSVSFVVPQTKFEDFRTELESMVGSRFLSIDVNSQNLLPQKQGIEQQQTSVETTIADLTAAKKKLATTHGGTVAALQAQIDTNDREIVTLKTDTSTDPTIKAQIAARLLVLASAQTDLKNRISRENSSYAYQRDSYDLQIKYANTNLDAVKTADQNLLDNVATVSGTVSLRWISLWEIAQVYLPGYTIPGIFLALAALAYWWHRKKTSIVAV